MAERLTPEERLQKLKEKQAKIQRELRVAQAQISKDERKKRTKSLIEIGGLAEIAELVQQDKGALLGGLLHIAEVLRDNPKQFQEWKRKGDAVLSEREQARKKQ